MQADLRRFDLATGSCGFEVFFNALKPCAGRDEACHAVWTRDRNGPRTRFDGGEGFDNVVVLTEANRLPCFAKAFGEAVDDKGALGAVLLRFGGVSDDKRDSGKCKKT